MRALCLATAFAILLAPSTAVAGQAKDDKYDPNKIICKKTKATGSRLVTERVCLTRKQWNEMSARTQEHHEEQMEYGRRINTPRG